MVMLDFRVGHHLFVIIPHHTVILRSDTNQAVTDLDDSHRRNCRDRGG